MTNRDTQHNKHFCIFDYFLDGVFLRWEEVKGECPVLIRGQEWIVNLEDGTRITTTIVEIEDISESECRIFLRSC